MFRRSILLAAVCLLGFAGICQAKTGDTLVVQTFSFGSKQDSTFVFPKDTLQYQKILMYYTLKCNSKQSPACGQWDYLTYTYLYKPTNQKDSSVLRIDSFFDAAKGKYVKDTLWKVFFKQERFELARYITPYGINLSLGNGFTWVFDVTDYGPLLHDSVHLSAGNWQELLNVKFLFVQGKSPRRPYKVVNVWNGNFWYGDPAKSTESYLDPRSVVIDPNAVGTKMKIRVTGHGFGDGDQNCSEFCAKKHSLDVNGTKRWEKLVWRDNCGLNPVYPQGGTWVYNRANWCPGAEVETYDAELTPYVTAGQSSQLDYNVEPTYTWNGLGNKPYYAVETQLVYYQPASFTLDAAVDNILSPSAADMYKRINPACGSPEIVIRNTGTTALTSLIISYGVKGGPVSTYNWKGNLKFMETQHVFLDPPFWAGTFPNAVFYATVSRPNGGQDEYVYNNTVYTKMPVVPRLDNRLIVQLKTNNAASENAWTMKDGSGKLLYSRGNFQPNTTYSDTVDLPNGCVEFRLIDSGGDGLSFFANPNAGNGTLRFYRASGTVVKAFGADFGEEVIYNFMAGYGMSVPEENQTEDRLVIWPNPASHLLHIDLAKDVNSIAGLEVLNAIGKEIPVLRRSFIDDKLTLDVSGLKPGIYFLRLTEGQRSYTRKVVLY